MEDKSLLRIALFCAFIGLGLLFFIYESVDVEVSEFDEIENKSVGDYVKVVGEISSVRASPGMYILEIGDQKNTVPVVIFAKEKLRILKGNYISVGGEIEEYKGKKEIIASEVEIL